MTSPPSSLPSPTPSTSSSSHPQSFSALSMPPPASLNRASSATSGFSAGSGRESKASGFVSNGHAGPIDESFSNGYHEPSQQTPQPQHNEAGFQQHTHSLHHPFLPSVTSSPPPQAPLYVPPPQHAMAPDPIHTLMGQQGMVNPNGPTQAGWNPNQNGWRGVPNQQRYTPTSQHFPRQMANGHMPNVNSLQHQLPPNPVDSYSGRGPLSSLGMNGRPGSRAGESRERRRDRDSRDERDGEEEVITTIFVVGFPDDMLVGLPARVVEGELALT